MHLFFELTKQGKLLTPPPAPCARERTHTRTNKGLPSRARISRPATQSKWKNSTGLQKVVHGLTFTVSAGPPSSQGVCCYASLQDLVICLLYISSSCWGIMQISVSRLAADDKGSVHQINNLQLQLARKRAAGQDERRNTDTHWQAGKERHTRLESNEPRAATLQHHLSFFAMPLCLHACESFAGHDQSSCPSDVCTL